MSTEGQLFCLDASAGYDIALDQSCVRISRLGSSDQLVPLRRIDRVIIRNPRDRALITLLELVRRGIEINFQDGRGNLTAALTPPAPRTDPTYLDWASIIDRRCDVAPYLEWRVTQLRHAASRIIGHAPLGTMESFELKLVREAQGSLFDEEFERATREVEALLWAWLDGELFRRGLRVVVDALRLHHQDWPRDLRRCLWIPLLHELGPFLHGRARIQTRDYVAYFESQREVLTLRLNLHIAALQHHLLRAPLHYVSDPYRANPDHEQPRRKTLRRLLRHH